jgi:hypothetical protein
MARTNTPRKSKLDPYKVLIQRWLERHPYSAQQIFQRLRTERSNLEPPSHTMTKDPVDTVLEKQLDYLKLVYRLYNFLEDQLRRRLDPVTG